MSSSSSNHGPRTCAGRIRRATSRIATVGALIGASLGSGVAIAQADPTASSVDQPGASVGAAGKPDLTAGRYIVSFAGAPAATYTGGVAGMSRTAPVRGARLAPGDASVRRYVSHLQKQKRSALAKAGVADYTDYSLVLNGVAANLTAPQARALAHNPAVASMAKDRMQKVQTDKSPQFLGVPALWKSLGGRDRAGSGVVVGVLDTGIWPESESFKPNGTPIPSSFAGPCQSGQDFGPQDCNGKIVGARYYLDGYGEENISDEEYASPRDGDGHGSHTASTAAGDRVDNVRVDNSRFGTLSGMAPGAKVAAYKVCWTGKPGVSEDGCKTSDIVAAINDAVRDGVDVINFSIGGASESPVNDPQEVAFLNAAAAGVFVSASAGNSGPGAATLDHPSPWVTTVAASTFKVSEAVLELADGRRFVGASSTPTLPKLTPMVLSSASAAAGADPADARLCLPESLDPVKVKGKLVVCVRGVNPRAEKSYVVKEAGGVGMVLINATPNSLNGDLHYVPSVHLPNTALAPVTAYVEGGGAAGRIVPVRPGESSTKAPEVAEFSSRGPSTTTDGNIMKPDLAAPGVDVLAAVTPYNNHGRNYDMLSGTSMAAPHVAGLAALLMQAHPGWTPMAVKSALMTTARDMATRTSPFAQGAGNVRPALATDPGIVFDAGIRDWIGYLKSQDLIAPGAYSTIPAITGSNLNQASIAVGSLAGSARVTRTVTSVSNRTENYRFAANVPGFSVNATPGQFTLRPGESKTVSIGMRRTTAPIEKWATGSVVFSSSAGADTGDATPRMGHIAELPVTLKPVLVQVDPTEITGAVPAGQASVKVTPGSNGVVSSTVTGLVGTTPEKDTIGEGVFDPAAPAAGPATDVRTFEVPAGTSAVRFDTSMPNVSNDVDMYVYQVAGGKEQLVALSGTATGNELVVMQDPKPGTYKVYVNGYTIADAGDYTFRGWVVPKAASGNLTVAPASFLGRQSVSRDLTVKWTGLDPAKAWFGSVGFSVDGTKGAMTRVLVE